MIKIFILEDDRDRIEGLFLTNFDDEEKFQVVISDEVEHAKEAFLRNAPFDVVFLDHDLGGEIFVKSSEPNTGYQFARFLSSHQEKMGHVIIHSMNPMGVAHMATELPKAVRAYYGSSEFRSIISQITNQETTKP